MAKDPKVYLFKTDTTKSGNPVFDGDVARTDVVNTYYQPRIGQWFGDRASLEHGALVPKTLREGYGTRPCHTSFREPSDGSRSATLCVPLSRR